MREEGLGGASSTALGFLLPMVVLLPFALARWRKFPGRRGELAAGGFCLALAIALYAEGVVRGQVARVILLFYLTPVWSTLLARIFLGEPITARRVATVILGLAGLLVIFGAGAGVPLPGSSAEWMGLAAGMSWAVAMVSVNRSASHPPFDHVFAQFVFLAPVFALIALIPGGPSGPVLELHLPTGSLPWLLAFALVWMLPVVWLTVFGARRLDPGRVAIFLMFEIVVGLTTAGLLTDEPFGPRELAGATLIMAATAVEARAAVVLASPPQGGRAASRRRAKSIR
jgi:drug/metabolite transporter (DMT)-like permease